MNTLLGENKQRAKTCFTTERYIDVIGKKTADIRAATESAKSPSYSNNNTWKHAIVTPLRKKAGLDESVPTNYHLVSNLPFLSKVLVRIVHRQLISHLYTADLGK